MNGGQVQRQSSSYRQGLVLGLTMAEMMLLLVFCLLVASSVALRYEREQRIAIESQLLTTVDAQGDSEAHRMLRDAQAYRRLMERIKRYPPLAELLEKTPSTAREAEIDDAWRKLIESAEVARELSRAGIDAATAKRDAHFFAEAKRMKNENLDLNQLREEAKSVRLLKQLLAENKISGKTTSEIVDLAKVGLRVRQEKLDNGHKWPPIISLSEAGGYYFESGRAELSSEFKVALTDKVVPRILDIA